MKPHSAPFLPRDPGPSWGFRFLARTDALLPRPLFDFLVGLGTWVAVAAMPRQRAYSRAYLRHIRQRPPALWEVWRHFFTFAQALMRKLRAAAGQAYPCRMDPSSTEFTALMASGRPALLGTFHFGDSDMLGFMISHFRRRVAMIRLRTERTRELQELASSFGNSLRFIWVNQADDLLFTLKAAIEEGSSIAMQCDRPDFSSKLEAFQFLGGRRLFPFTIYHLALIFQLPVIYCLAVPTGANGSVVHNSPVFEPGGDSKREHLERARAHFQDFLLQVEAQLNLNPYLWFNFTPLNPVASDAPVPAALAT